MTKIMGCAKAITQTPWPVRVLVYCGNRAKLYPYTQGDKIALCEHHYEQMSRVVLI